MGVILGAFPESWGDVAKDLSRLKHSQLDLDDIQRRLRAFEVNTKARLGAANKVGAGKPSAKPRGGMGHLCTHCERGVHEGAICYSKLREDYMRQYPGQPSPPTPWLWRIVRAGKRLPIQWAPVIKEFGHPSQSGKPPKLLGHTRQAHCTYMDNHRKHTPSSSPQLWCADSGATKHMCKDKTLFTQYTPFHTRGYIQGATQGMTSPVVGKGQVELVQHDTSGQSHTLVLHDVLHVPTLHDNLLSLTRLDHHGLTVSMGDRQCKIENGGITYGQGTLVEGLYVLEYPGSESTLQARQAHGPLSSTPPRTATTLSTPCHKAVQWPDTTSFTQFPRSQSPTREPSVSLSHLYHHRLGHPTPVSTPCHSASWHEDCPLAYQFPLQRQDLLVSPASRAS